MKILAIREKLFEEKVTATGFAIKSVGSEGVESEYSVTGEITGFGKAEGVKATNMGTMRNLVRPSGITTGTAQGVITTTTGILWFGNSVMRAKPLAQEGDSQAQSPS